MVRFTRIRKGVVLGCFALLCSLTASAQGGNQPAILNTFLPINSSATTTPEIKPHTITISNLCSFNTLVTEHNYKRKTVKLSSFKNKLEMPGLRTGSCIFCFADFSKSKELQTMPFCTFEKKQFIESIH